ncbi:LOW QUALITY PROTEIN: protein LATERAL ROOT PRIMORDIUM 1-like [Primulina tabacum]|uniref:LOW QUALITY PROTEIN: protein LATERAL ROOT PRIMORDIUM 1-like n=1 Tax=Primulina tabacum TaxID=48773 RepID=UPI003F598701
MWSSVASTRHINCGLPPEFFFVAPASSFQNHHPDASAAAAATTINFDPYPFSASSAIGVGVGVGVIPLLTATPCLAQQNIGSDGSANDDVLNIARSRSSGGMQLWQHQQSQNSSAYSSKKPLILDHTSLLQSGTGGIAASGIGGSSSSLGTTTCQDCGNQAKKDCIHRRCRTCCKSRGYDCVTHVRSTWVSASRRRERQIARENIPAAGSSQSTSGTKKPRLCGTSQTTTTASHTSTSNTTPPRSFDTSSSHQDASFRDSLPGQVHAPAVFKCVRVTSLDDGEDEYAYQAVVKIEGHVFKGFLYDQGIEGRDGSFPNISELHLGGGGGSIAGRGGASSTQTVLRPTDNLTSPGGGFLGGTSYGNPMN